MRITDLQVDGFGVWSGLTVEEVSPGLTVFYGPNEAGKTTLLQFVRAMLYGFAADRRERYLPPVFGGRGGGSLQLSVHGSDFRVRRLVLPGQPSDEEGELTVTADDGAVAGEDALQQLLGNVNESVFSNVFAIGLREIQELATLNDTEAAHELYKLASGLDRVSLIDVMRDLRSEREFLLGTNTPAGAPGASTSTASPAFRPPGDSPYSLPALAERLRELERQIEQARGQAKRWTKLGAEIADIDRELVNFETTIDEAEVTGRRLELAMQIAPRWRERDGLCRRLEALGELPPPDRVSLARLDRVNSKLSGLEARSNEYSRRLKSLRSEARQLPLVPYLLEHAGRIEALAEHRPWIDSLRKQIVRLREEMRDLHREMGLSPDGADDAEFVSLDEKTLEVSSRTIAKLKPAVRSLRKHRQRFESAQQAEQEAERVLAETQEAYEGLLLEYDCEDLDEALEGVGRSVNQIKRRQAVDERLERLEQQRRQLEEEVDEANEEQVMPVGRTLLVGLFVVVGSGLAFFGFAGLLLASVTPNPLLGVVGVALALCGWVVKLVGDTRARNQVERTQRQVDLLASQLRRAKQEREALPLPDAADGEGTTLAPAEALTRAQEDLAQLEELLPLRAEVQACRQAHDEAAAEVTSCREQLEQAQRRWEAALTSVQLPASLTPARVKALSEQSERISEARQRLATCRQELLEREEELERLTGRAFALVREAHGAAGQHASEGLDRLAAEITSGSNVSSVSAAGESDTRDRFDNSGCQADAGAAIEGLLEVLAEQRRWQEQHAELKREYKQQRRELRTLQRQRRRLENFRERMFSSAGVKDEAAFRETATRLGQQEQLQQQLGQLDQQIDAAIGKSFPRDEVLELIAERGEKGLETAWEAQLATIEELEQQRNQLTMLRGERVHEMKTLGEDRTSDRLEWEAETVRGQMRRAAQRWKTLTLTHRILDSVRRRYEQERQPDTLLEASRYLKTITRGKYTRIWTRLEGDVLFVDQQDQQTLRVDVLSQGTREAIFLSLRLALASAYARRGIEFPLVLDDLLVNYDAIRTRAAAQLLLNYAERGRQVILFTCHDHIRDLFHELQADVRLLPAQRDVLERDATAERYVVTRWVEEVVEEEVEEELEEAPLEDEYEAAEDVAEEAEAEAEAAAEDEFEDDEIEDDEFEDEEDSLEDSLEDEAFSAGEEEDADEDESVEEDSEEEAEVEAWDASEWFEDEEEEPTAAETEEAYVESSPDWNAEVSEWNEDLERDGTPRRERFTWNSPDMWWEDDGEDAA